MTSDALERLSPATQAWFTAAFSAPTPAQQGAWAAIAGGRHALVVAPTGSGKTLAAFLWALDRLASTPPPAEKLARCRVLYVSPLKALAVDIERNLRSPLAGIRHAATRLGLPEPAIRVGVRSGDTPADERRRLATAPPDILITTPESLFLLLTSQAREALRGVETVIVDEIHAVAGTKRGAHLAVCLERLDALLERPAQRIGLSATVRPASEVARFLGGQQPVDIVSPTTSKTVELRVEVTVEDMAAIGEISAPTPAGPGAPGDGASAASAEARTSIWPSIERRVLELVRGAKSTIVFANSRRLAERLCSRLNELAEADALEQLAKSDQADPGEAEAPYPPLGRFPAQLGGQAGIGGSPSRAGFTEVARPHHGSMSREQRSEVEEALKSGRLPCVVATSSLELGIDMGAVDLVIQVESPPSVASGLQRVGRAGHQVGAASTGVLLPKHRGDLLPCAVVAERMAAGAIESLVITRNPLDVLAQHVVAMVSVEPWDALELLELVRRAAPYSSLPTSAYEGVLDMLAGRYPSDAFAELRPRLVWDRVDGTLTARPGAQRLAVTSGGTIPDRGLFGVYLIAGSDGGGPGRRVGEFDEEMVYESRVGDVILLGSSSWRIEDIGADRVLVSPAPGQPGKLPFWHGDAPGRPIELGRAMGAFARELSGLDPPAAAARLAAAGLDEWAQSNLLSYLAEQREATGALPDDRTIVVERFRDELGDWRLAVHSPFGAQVHAPWALAAAARIRESTGLDVQVLHSDDGLILRLPDADEPPSADLVLLAAEDVEQIVQSEVGGSALFASRFRECAARALLLPRRDPTRRTPLWQQRQRAAQLLSVASIHPDFPIVLEAVRECLQDVFDVPGLVSLMRDLAGRAVRLVEVETAAPSPFARSLLFGYVGAFMYEGDSPLAERRAQALSLDSRLLAELLGSAELRELLDPDALAEIEAELQRLAPGRQARGVEGIADLLRVLGDLTPAEIEARLTPPEDTTVGALVAELEAARRALRVRVAGEERWVAVEDAGRLRDALGVPMPVGVPDAFLEPVKDPFADLVSRFARTRGPFVAADVAARYGLGTALVTAALDRLAARGRLLSGEFRPGGSGQEWCDAEVLRMLRRRSLAKLRREVEPVPASALSRFLPDWLGTGSAARRGTDALARAIEQLAGAAIPASALETLVLPARVRDYSPAQLDELCASGEIVWAGAGSLPGNDGWLRLVPAEAAALLLPPPLETLSIGPPHEAILAALEGGQALFFRALADAAWAGSESADDATLVAALWDLVWAGYVTNDTLAPMRVLLAGKAGGGRSAAVAPPRRRSRYARYGRPALPTRAGPPTAGGRWWRLPDRDPAATRRLHAVAEALLDRHGVLTRGAVAAEQIPGGFSAVYPVLSAFEDAGRCRRGYFVEGLGAAQFAVPGAVDRMRALAAEAQRAEQEPAWTSPIPPSWEARDAQRAGTRTPGLVLAATDPASPYGAALAWPERGGGRGGDGGHRPGRKAGALVVIVEGELVMYVERGGKSLLTWSDDVEALAAAAEALATATRAGALGRLSVERADGEPVFGADAVARALAGAGFRATPRGLRLRG